MVRTWLSACHSVRALDSRPWTLRRSQARRAGSNQAQGATLGLVTLCHCLVLVLLARNRRRWENKQMNIEQGMSKEEGHELTDQIATKNAKIQEV